MCFFSRSLGVYISSVVSPLRSRRDSAPHPRRPFRRTLAVSIVSGGGSFPSVDAALQILGQRAYHTPVFAPEWVAPLPAFCASGLGSVHCVRGRSRFGGRSVRRTLAVSIVSGAARLSLGAPGAGCASGLGSVHCVRGRSSAGYGQFAVRDRDQKRPAESGPEKVSRSSGLAES